MPMPASSSGGTWNSGDTIGKAAMNLKTHLDISFATYTPSIGTDTVAGQLVIDSNGCVLYVVNAANNAYGIAIDQSLRKVDSPTFIQVNATNLILGGTYNTQLLSGSLEFGDSASVWDTHLTRDSAGVLKAGEAFKVGTSLTVGSLSGVLKAAAGLISGSATLDDVGEGTTYKRVTATIYGYLSNANAQLSNLYTTTSPSFAGLTVGSLSSTWGNNGGWLTLNGNSTVANPTLIFAEASSTTWGIYTYTDNKMHWSTTTDKMTLDPSGNLVISGKLTQSGCLPKDISLEEVTQYIVDCQDKKERITQEELDALERIVLNQMEEIALLKKKLSNN